MIIKQLSIFLENKSGRLTEVLQTLGEEKINITALTIADTSEYGILRMVVSEPDKALQVLKVRQFSVNLTDVLSIATPSEAGSFARALSLLSDEGISIEYMYAFSMGNKAAIIMRTDDIPATIEVMQKHKMELLNASKLYNI
ncbi:MAG TPA: ACT domain-containing protein [Bacteroidales bacterium]|nr:ACT domain-containing protein [Bacteroidales bacterium]